jgi:uncharacterized phage infection (PIP) family protein YhgE
MTKSSYAKLFLPVVLVVTTSLTSCGSLSELSSDQQESQNAAQPEETEVTSQKLKSSSDATNDVTKKLNDLRNSYKRFSNQLKELPGETDPVLESLADGISKLAAELASFDTDRSELGEAIQHTYEYKSEGFTASWTNLNSSVSQAKKIIEPLKDGADAERVSEVQQYLNSLGGGENPVMEGVERIENTGTIDSATITGITSALNKIDSDIENQIESLEAEIKNLSPPEPEQPPNSPLSSPKPGLSLLRIMGVGLLVVAVPLAAVSAISTYRKRRKRRGRRKVASPSAKVATRHLKPLYPPQTPPDQVSEQSASTEADYQYIAKLIEQRLINGTAISQLINNEVRALIRSGQFRAELVQLINQSLASASTASSSSYQPPQSYSWPSQTTASPKAYTQPQSQWNYSDLDYSNPQGNRQSQRELTPVSPTWINEYNREKSLLKNLKNVVEVSETKLSIENRRSGASYAPLLDQDRRGNYWVFEDGGKNYMVPSTSFKINPHNVDSVQALFDCRGYSPEGSKQFQLMHPAEVVRRVQGQGWELTTTIK